VITEPLNAARLSNGQRSAQPVVRAKCPQTAYGNVERKQLVTERSGRGKPAFASGDNLREGLNRAKNDRQRKRLRVPEAEHPSANDLTGFHDTSGLCQKNGVVPWAFLDLKMAINILA
jgi:hypothetical protein